jgi:short-subunit dehydrogenase
MSDQSKSAGGAWLGVSLAATVAAIVTQQYRSFVAREKWRQAKAEQGRGVALVTGASSGIGAEFARQLAGRKYDLLLIARREDRLQRLAAQLSDWHAIQADVMVADLSQPTDVDRVCERIAATHNLQLLVNNAGFGISGPFAESDLDAQVDMIELHVLAGVRLMRAALPVMLEHQHGGIINVSSLASYVALPTAANYSATKSYLAVFSAALQAELRHTGVRAQALCPGFTVSEFHGESDTARREGIPGFLWLDAGQVVRESLTALENDHAVCVPGVIYKAIAPVLRSGLLSGLASFYRG